MGKRRRRHNPAGEAEIPGRAADPIRSERRSPYDEVLEVAEGAQDEAATAFLRRNEGRLRIHPELTDIAIRVAHVVLHRPDEVEGVVKSLEERLQGAVAEMGDAG